MSKTTWTVWTLVLVFVLTAGCSTSGGNKADQSPTAGSVQAPERALPYPAQTRFVAKFRFDRVHSGIDRVVGSLKGAKESDESQNSELPSAQELGSFFVASAIGADVDERRLMPKLQGVGRDEPLGPTFEALALDRPSLVALTTQPNAQMLDYMALSIPYSGAELLRPGVWLRFFIPARDGKVSNLKSQIQRACKSKQACPRLHRIDTHKRWVVIDGRFGPQAASKSDDEQDVDKKGSNDSPSLTTEGATVFKEVTPAARRFFQDDTAVSLYSRSDDIPAYGGLMGAIEITEALRGASPENRAVLLRRGFNIAGASYRFQSPGTREMGDFTFGFGLNDGQWQLHAVMSRTESGSKVAKAAEVERTLPQIQAKSPALTVDWGLNISRSLRAANMPKWAREASTDGSWRQLFEAVRSGGLWPYATVFLSHPTGMLKTVHEMRADMPNRRAEQAIATAASVNAIRARISVENSDSAPGGYAPRGGIAVGYTGDPPLLNRIKQSAPMLSQALGTDVTIDVESSDKTDHQLLKIGLGKSDGTFGEPTDVDTGIDAKLDFKSLSKVRQLASVPGWSLVSDQQALHLRTDGSRSALEINMATGRDPVELKPPTPSDKPLKQPASINSCLDSAVKISRDSIEQLGDSEDRNKKVGETIDQLEATLEECDSPTQSVTRQINLIRIGWLELRAETQLAAVDPMSALASAEEACRVRNAEHCATKDRFERIAEGFQPPMTSAAHLKSRQLANGSILIGQSDLHVIGQSSVLPRAFEKPGRLAELVESGNPPGEDETMDLRELLQMDVISFEPIGGKGANRVSVVVVPIDRRRNWKTTEYLVRAGTTLDRSRRELVEAAMLGREKPPKNISAALLPVDSGHTDFDAVPSLLLHASKSTKPKNAVRVRLAVSKDGVEASANGVDLDNPDDCGGNQPAFCVRDADRVDELIESISNRSADSERSRNPRTAGRTADALADQYRVDELKKALGQHGSTPLYFEVDAAPDLPTGLVARIIAAATEQHTDRDKNRVPVVRIVTGGGSK